MPTSKLAMIGLTICLAVSSCGRNDEPLENPSNSGRGDAEGALCPNATKVTSKGGSWSISPHWEIGPKMGGEDLIENIFCMNVHDSNGEIAQSVENVQVVGWMPKMGHDTGSEKPEVHFVKNGVVKVRNIFFIMTDQWEVIVRARVNQLEDEARFSVYITE